MLDASNIKKRGEMRNVLSVRRLTAVVMVIAFMAGSLMLWVNSATAAVVPGVNSLASYPYQGTYADGHTTGGLMSADGTAVILTTSATNISPLGSGVYIRNLVTGETKRLDTSDSGVYANQTISPLAISATGRYVVFRTSATNLIDGTTVNTSPTTPQLYLRDTKLDKVTLISKDPLLGTISDKTIDNSLGVSSDGRFITFLTRATNLHPDATNGRTNLYMFDKLENTLSILNRKTNGEVVSSSSWSPVGAMSCDGSLIVFQPAGNLIHGDTSSGHADVYLLDRRGATDKLTNLTKFANAAALVPTISCNGDYIGFQSLATNIDPTIEVPSEYQAYRPYVYDRINQTYHFMAVRASGAASDRQLCSPGGSLPSCLKISDTGLAIFTDEDALLTGAEKRQLYLWDINNPGAVELVSRNFQGDAANGDVWRDTFSISADGRKVSYGSSATNLVSNSGNKYGVYTSLTGR